MWDDEGNFYYDDGGVTTSEGDYVAPADDPAAQNNAQALDGGGYMDAEGNVYDSGGNYVSNVQDQQAIVLPPFQVSADPLPANDAIDTGGDFFSGIFSAVGGFFKSNATANLSSNPFNFGNTGGGGSSGGSSSGGSQQQQPKPPTQPTASGMPSTNTLLLALAVGGVAYALGSRRD